MILTICIISLIGISVIVLSIMLGVSLGSEIRDGALWFTLSMLVFSLAAFVFSIVNFVDNQTETYQITTPKGTYELIINENETDIKKAIFEKEGITYVEVK